MLPWLLACVLASGAGLLAFGMITLWRTAQDAEARVERAVQAETERLARVVRERLADAAAVFAAVPRTAQFEVAAGALVVPPQVQWLDEPPDPLELLPPAVWATRREAREAEFVAGQPTRALELLRAAAGATAEVLGRRNLQLTLGFAAHRAGRQDLLAELLPVLIEPLEPAWPCAADTALLLATCGRDVPAWVDAALATLAPERARAVVARVAELHPRAKSTALELAAEAQAARAVLVAVRGELPALLAAAAPQQLRADQLLLWWPAGPDAGRGVLAPAQSLIADLGGRDLTAAGLAVALAEPLPEGATLLLPPSLALVPPAVASAVVRPWALTVLLGALALVFAGALTFTLAALRREAAANAARSDFLVSVTHELKTPIAAMRLLTEMLDEDRVRSEAQRRDYYKMLAGEAVRLQALVDNVLDLGRLERGERALDLRPCPLGEVVRHAVEVFAPLVAREGRAVQLLGDDLLACVRVDRAALTQALLNVLDNARKYAPTGPLQVEVRMVGAQGEVRVRDFGPGVPLADRERIFVRFVRGAAQRSGSVPGVGLGLYLARGIAQAHGGALTCEEPADGPGAVFCLSLPLAPQEVASI